MGHKFDPKKLEKLNNPERVKLQDPEVMYEALGLQDPQCLVDVGAGTGFYSKLFLERMATGRVYALDISDDMLGWMYDNLEEVKDGRIQPMKMQESQMPLDDGVADAVVMLNLHHELHEPQALLADCLRILKPGGRILISDWKPVDREMGPPKEISKNHEQIERDLAQAGFVSIESRGSFQLHGLTLASKAE